MGELCMSERLPKHRTGTDSLIEKMISDDGCDHREAIIAASTEVIYATTV